MACSEVAKDLKANLCAYDYTGYGQSKGRASIPDTIADIDAVFQWLLRRDIDKQDIILYGQSLGSGPTLDLAARERYIGGVVLHAAFASGARVHLPTRLAALAALPTKTTGPAEQLPRLCCPCWGCAQSKGGGSSHAMLARQADMHCSSQRPAVRKGVHHINVTMCMHAGLRQVRPGGRHFPSWFDIFPNSENVQKVEAPVCVLHVRPLAFISTHMTLTR